MTAFKKLIHTVKMKISELHYTCLQDVGEDFDLHKHEWITKITSKHSNTETIS